MRMILILGRLLALASAPGQHWVVVRSRPSMAGVRPAAWAWSPFRTPAVHGRVRHVSNDNTPVQIGMSCRLPPPDPADYPPSRGVRALGRLLAFSRSGSSTRVGKGPEVEHPY